MDAEIECGLSLQLHFPGRIASLLIADHGKVGEAGGLQEVEYRNDIGIGRPRFNLQEERRGLTCTLGSQRRHKVPEGCGLAFDGQ